VYKEHTVPTITEQNFIICNTIITITLTELDVQNPSLHCLKYRRGINNCTYPITIQAIPADDSLQCTNSLCTISKMAGRAVDSCIRSNWLLSVSIDATPS